MWFLAALGAFRSSKAFVPALVLLASAALVFGGMVWNERGHTINKLENKLKAKERADEIENDVDTRDDDGLVCGIVRGCD